MDIYVCERNRKECSGVKFLSLWVFLLLDGGLSRSIYIQKNSIFIAGDLSSNYIKLFTNTIKANEQPSRLIPDDSHR